MSLIYFAAPLFCRAELAFNLDLAVAIERLGHMVFLPQRDGVETDGPAYEAMAEHERGRAIFEIDRDKVLEADIFLFVLDGRVPDEGACVELGIAYAHKRLQRPDKLLLGLHTDMRAAFAEAKLNPMLGEALDEIYTTEKKLLARLASER